MLLEVVVPARNEAARLRHGLRLLSARLDRLPFDAAVIVVDNASTDGTADIVRAWRGPVPVRLLHCAERGKGAAVKAGMLATAAPYVGFCDADMATDLDALDRAVELLRGGEDVVVGSRRHPDSEVWARQHPPRRLGAIVFNLLCRDAVGGITDTQCGFKFFAGPLARAAAAELTTAGFAFDVELLMLCARRGARIRDIPVRWRDMPGSTFSIGRHGVECLRDVLRLRSGRTGKPRRIAVVNWRDPWHPEAGGAERYAWEVARRLAAGGADVRYLTCRAAGQRRRQRMENVEFIRLGGRFTVYPLVLIWMLIRRGSFDAVVDCENGIPFFTPWVLPRRVRVVCVIHHVHDAQFGMYFPWWLARFGRFLEGPVAGRTYRRHRTVAVSESTKAALRDRLRWPGPIHVIPNGLSIPAQATIPAPEPVLSCVARLVPHKRIERVIDLAERLRIGVHIIGRGPAAESLARTVAALGLGDIVNLHGYLTEEEKIALVAASTLHISASRGEGWGLSVIEAAALGVPSVAYDVEGLRDAIRDGVTGWLVPAGENLHDVVERALKELADPARRAEMAGACRHWAATFDWAGTTDRIEALLGIP